MEIKVQCPCGVRFAFEAEPVAGRFSGPIECPQCGADGTELANDVLRAATTPPGPHPPEITSRAHAAARGAAMNRFAAAAASNLKSVDDEAAFQNPTGERPGAVTAACWMLILFGGFSLLVAGAVAVALFLPEAREKMLELLARGPIPAGVKLTFLLVEPAVLIPSGILMLRGNNAARLVFGVWAAASSLVFSMTLSCLSVLVNLVAVVLVFRPQAEMFFRRPKQD